MKLDKATETPGAWQRDKQLLTYGFLRLELLIPWPLAVMHMVDRDSKVGRRSSTKEKHRPCS